MIDKNKNNFKFVRHIAKFYSLYIPIHHEKIPVGGETYCKVFSREYLMGKTKITNDENIKI